MWQELLNDTLGFLKFAGTMVVIAAICFGVVSPLVYHSCKVTAQIMNTEFGTSYTAGDIFWARETIENIVLGQKARIDLNDARE